jgi:hypothetical protein
MGSFDPKGADWGAGTVGISVLDPAGFGIAYHAIELSRSGDGVAVVGRTKGNVEYGPLTFPGTTQLEVSLEHDGDEVIYLARAPGDADYQEIGRTATTYTGPYRASFDVGGLKRRSVVGLDDLQVVSSATPPDQTTATNRARTALERAGEALLDAARGLDGAGNDVTAGRAALAAAEASLDAAAAELPSVPGSVASIAKKIASARKKLLAANKKLDKGKPSRTAVGPLKAAGKQLAGAAARLP